MIKFKEENGILIKQIKTTGATFKLNKPTNLKKFYIELHNLLVEEQYKDMLGTSKNQKIGEFQGGWVKAGEFVDGKYNRMGDVFEKKFILIEKQIGKDIEIIWKAFKKATFSTNYGWFEFELNLTNRFMQDKEFLEGNNKKILQSGTFEFRNKYFYKNNIKIKYLSKIPIIKNSPMLQNLFINQIYNKTLKNDIKNCEEKLYVKIHNLIEKHFI